MTLAPCRASGFTILIKSARPHPLYPRVRIDFIGLAASAAARRDSWALECSTICRNRQIVEPAKNCEPAKNKVGAGPAVRMLITQFYTVITFFMRRPCMKCAAH